MLKYVLKVLIKYNIIKNLKYFVIDNVPDNNIIIALLSFVLRRDFRLNYNLIYYCICCQGHVINLTVKSFLFISDKKTLNKDKKTSVYTVIIAQIKKWKKKRPLKKLYNFVFFNCEYIIIILLSRIVF
jgi:hypothetical protein